MLEEDFLFLLKGKKNLGQFRGLGGSIGSMAVYSSLEVRGRVLK